MNPIYNRVSIRKYQDKPVEKEKTMAILRAAMQAPSAANQQPWEFFVVTNRTKLEALSKVTPYTGYTKDAPIAIVAAYRKECRSVDFAPIDIYESHATKFLIKDGKILPPFVAISGLGESAAWDLMEGRKGKTFLSIEEVSVACPKVSKTHMQMLKEAGAFGSLPDTSQVSFF